jgi:solute carrier family 25 aspartate/glutamate transporter 12/13
MASQPLSDGRGFPKGTGIREVVKESLLGSQLEPQLTAQTKATFKQYALYDSESGEDVMFEKEFVNAIAPETEDYVSAFFVL